MNLKNLTRRAAGRRCEVHHHRCKLTDHEVEVMRQMHEEFPRGDPRHMGRCKLAEKFGVSKRYAGLICAYTRR